MGGRLPWSPYAYDRAEIKRVLLEEGLAAAESKWPLPVVRPIARVLGLLPPWRGRTAAVVKWKTEWDTLLGTKPDQDLAAELLVPRGTLVRRRTLLGIPPMSVGQNKKDQYIGLASSLSDDELKRPVHELTATYGLPFLYVKAERQRRGILIRRGSPTISLDPAALRRAAIAGMLAAYSGVAKVNLSAMAEIIGVSREYVRQCIPQILAAIQAAEAADEAEPTEA